MNQKQIDLTACCGLYCGDCLRFESRTSDLAQEIILELENENFESYAEAKAEFAPEFNRYGECLRILEAIAGLRCDTPCALGGDGCAEACEIKICAEANGLSGCWECEEFEGCELFEFLEPLHGDAPKENLRKIKELGLGEWAEHRARFYVWS